MIIDDEQLLLQCDSILSLILYREKHGLSQTTIRELDILITRLRTRTNEIVRQNEHKSPPTTLSSEGGYLPEIQYTTHHVKHFTKPHVEKPIESNVLQLIAIDKREVCCPDCFIYMIQERKRRWSLLNWIRIKRKQ